VPTSYEASSLVPQAKKWEPYGEASLPIENDGALPRQRDRKPKGRAGSPSVPTLIRGLKPRARAKKSEPYGEASLPIHKDGALPRQRVRKNKGRAASPTVPTLVEGSAGCSHGTPPSISLWRTSPLPCSAAQKTPLQSGAAAIEGRCAAASAWVLVTGLTIDEC